MIIFKEAYPPKSNVEEMTFQYVSPDKLDQLYISFSFNVMLGWTAFVSVETRFESSEYSEACFTETHSALLPADQFQKYYKETYQHFDWEEVK